jgi:hypothetical protein
MFFGWSLYDELKPWLPRLPPAEALRMATINPAQWHGAADSEGSIGKGKVGGPRPAAL